MWKIFLVALILLLGLTGIIIYGAILYEIDKIDKKIKEKNRRTENG